MQSASLIDLDALSPEELRAAILAVSEIRKREETRSNWQRAISEETDEAIIARAQERYPDAPITLANRYQSVHRSQEIGGICGAVMGEDRRPVFMRGAAEVLIRRYCYTGGGSSPNGWAIAVYWRCIRMSRKTFMSHDAFEEFSNGIRDRLRQRYRLTSVFEYGTGLDWRAWNDRDYRARIIGGKLVRLTDEQCRHIEALQAIIGRTEKLDQQARRALVASSMYERLAA